MTATIGIVMAAKWFQNPYTEPTTIPESIPVTETTTEAPTTTTSSSVQIIDQKTNTPESIKDDFTDKQHNSETSALEKGTTK